MKITVQQLREIIERGLTQENDRLGIESVMILEDLVESYRFEKSDEEIEVFYLLDWVIRATNQLARNDD
jgi:hypothetical protein